jgi:hypothetical protein
VRIRAIETEYAGYRFRSRQEARFAVMMDALGIGWRYEVEGLEIVGKSQTVYYLPDFIVDATGAYIEIKGAEPTEQEFAKATMLAQATNSQVAIFWGPFKHVDFKRNNVLFWTPRITSNLGVFKTERGSGLLALGPQSWDYDALDEALRQARHARFEHGE